VILLALLRAEVLAKPHQFLGCVKNPENKAIAAVSSKLRKAK
jgi:hypothetical protein